MENHDGDNHEYSLRGEEDTPALVICYGLGSAEKNL